MKYFKLSLFYIFLIPTISMGQPVDYIDFIIDEAEALYKSESYQDAVEKLNTVIVSDSTNGYAYFLRGECYYALMDAENAFSNYDKAHQINPSNIPTYYQRTVTKQFMEKSLVDICPDWERLNQMISLEGDHEELLEKTELPILCDMLSKMTSDTVSDKNNSYDFMHYGLMALNEKETISAKLLTLTAIEFNPKNDKAYYNLSLVYSAMGDSKKELEWLLKTIQINPQNDGAHQNLAQCYYDKKEMDKSLKFAKKAAQLGNEACRSWLKDMGRVEFFDNIFAKTN